MCLASYFQRRLELMAPQETITFTRESLEWLLAEHGATSVHESSLGVRDLRTPVMTRTLLNVADLAAEFRTAESSMRALVADGLFGPATAPRDGIEGSKRKLPFRVPAKSVAAAREMVGQGHKLHTFCVMPSRSSGHQNDGSTDHPFVNEVAPLSVDRQVDSRIEDALVVATAPSSTQRKKRAPESLLRPTTPARKQGRDGDTVLGGWRKHVKQGG